MSSRRRHPLQAGEVVFPRQWYNCPRGGLQQDCEGKAVITGPGSAPHHYVVLFEGDTEACERGPLDESSTREEIV